MDSDEGVLIHVADLEVGAAITAHIDLLPSAPVSFLLAGNDIAVGASGHASVQGHIQVPEGEGEVHTFIKAATVSQNLFYLYFVIKALGCHWGRERHFYVMGGIKQDKYYTVSVGEFLLYTSYSLFIFFFFSFK